MVLLARHKDRQIISPHSVARPGDELSQTYERHVLWLTWLLFQSESDLSKSLITFSRVAFLAAADEVLPTRRTAQALGNDVVYRQVVSGVAAVLAGVVVASKNAPTRQFELWLRPFDMISKSNHGR